MGAFLVQFGHRALRIWSLHQLFRELHKFLGKASRNSWMLEHQTALAPALEGMKSSNGIPQTNSARTVVQLPIRSQTTFGGLPRKELLPEKSESFDTITKPFSRAYCQIRSSGAPRRPQFLKCAEPG
jgi:hypothetical protein